MKIGPVSISRFTKALNSPTARNDRPLSASADRISRAPDAASLSGPPMTAAGPPLT